MVIGKILADEALVVTFLYYGFFGDFYYFVLDFLKGIFTYFLFGFGSLFRTNTSNELARFASSSGF